MAVRGLRLEPTTGRGTRALRAGLRWLVGLLTVRTAIALTGVVLARRLDVGDESTATLRRVRTMGALRLRPRNDHLSRVRLDLVIAGGELDLGAVPKVPGGVDLTVHLVMAGLDVAVPPGWRVWWSSFGAGGVGLTEGQGVERTDDERGADLRVHARVWMAGVGIRPAA